MPVSAAKAGSARRRRWGGRSRRPQPGLSRASDPSRLITNFAVRDVLAVEAWLVETETTWIRELESTPWGTIGTVLDADGNYVQVLDDRGRRA